MSERVTLKPDEAAEALGVGVRTLQDWTAAGFIPSIKRGGVRLYSVDALREWAREASVYDGGGEGRRGQAKAMGLGVGLSAEWGRKVGRGRQRTPVPLRGNRAGGPPDAG